MAMETHRHELRQNVNLVDLAVDAIGNRNIDQAVFSAQRNRGLRTDGSKWEQAGTPAAAQYNSNDVAHFNGSVNF